MMKGMNYVSGTKVVIGALVLFLLVAALSFGDQPLELTVSFGGGTTASWFVPFDKVLSKIYGVNGISLEVYGRATLFKFLDLLCGFDLVMMAGTPIFEQYVPESVVRNESGYSNLYMDNFFVTVGLSTIGISVGPVFSFYSESGTVTYEYFDSFYNTWVPDMKSLSGSGGTVGFMALERLAFPTFKIGKDHAWFGFSLSYVYLPISSPSGATNLGGFSVGLLFETRE